ncbi:MAG: AbrB family transcriptional regulator [Rhizobiales bacterium]|nr:AbrB family transcriptional regulator [Hyphomicrobiales bacterium]NRB13138.1 AbrB family transcriptional regulator [Hyphomicrobiales bacterium]
MRSDFVIEFKTIMAGALGAIVAFYVGLPAPFLVGPTIVITLISLLGVATKVDIPLRNLCFIFIGISMGSGATPDIIASLIQWPISFLGLAVCIIIIMLGGAHLLRKLFQYRKKTALLASTPGHLSFVLALSEDTGGETQKIALVQSMRVLALIILVPVFLQFLDMDLPSLNVVQNIMGYQTTIILGLLAVALGYVFKKIRLPAAYLISGMVISTLLHVTNLVDGNLSQWVLVPSFVIMGSLVGTRFSGVKWETIKNSMGPGAVNILFAFIIAALGAYLVAQITGLPFAQILLSFAPGGVEAMIAMSILLNIDPTFVAAHHLIRLFFLATIVPFLFNRKD